MRRLAYFCGGFAAAVFGVVVRPALCWYVVALTLLLILALTHWRKMDIPQRGCILLAGLMVGLCYSGWYTTLYAQAVHSLAGDTHRITALVTQWPEKGNYGYGVEVSIQLEGAPDLTTWLHVDEVGENLQPGDTIHTIARLRDASVMQDGTSTNFYISQGIYLTGVAYGGVEMEHPDTIPWRQLPIHWTRTLQRGIYSAFSEETAPVVNALVTGDKSGLSDSFSSAIRRAGLSHIIVVSGMHMAFLVGVVTLLLGVNRRRTALVVIPVAILFAVMVGATPSVLRAMIMVIVLQLAPLFGRESDGITSLLFALLLILLGNPQSIAHVGLQLSFASLAGLLMFTPMMHRWFLAKISKKFGRKGTLPCRMVGGLLVAISAIITASLGASAFTIPIISYYFETISLIYTLSNLLISWVVAWCFVGGLLSGGVAVFYPVVGGHLAVAVEPFLQYFIHMVTKLGNIPFASLPLTSSIGVGWLVFSYLVLSLWLWRRGRIHPVAPIFALITILALTIGITIQQNRLGEISVTVLDVGQGQSVFLRMGDTTALVDCGGSQGETVGDMAADALIHSGHLTLDYLILTHCHLDHAGGVLQLMERVEVGQLILPITEGEDEGLRQEIIAGAEERDIPVLLVDSDYTISAHRGEIFLIPPLGDADENERGLAVLASYDEFDILITGDMGEETEKRLAHYYDLPQVELYLAGHHGSQYSSCEQLLDEIQPKNTAISVGYNSYGHPTQEVLERFQERNTAVYRTDTMGDITFRVGG